MKTFKQEKFENYIDNFSRKALFEMLICIMYKIKKFSYDDYETILQRLGEVIDTSETNEIEQDPPWQSEG